MENRLFGFLIDEETLLDITQRRLVRFTDTSSVNSMTIRVVSLNATMARLLTLLLITGSESIISKNDILINVWEGHDLSSSSQRLWHAISELKKKLSVVGISDDFILNIRDTGYFINSQYTVTSLFLG